VSKEKLILRELSPDDNVSGLSLGAAEFAPLKRFLKKDAKSYHQQNAAKTYVFCEESAASKIAAYITLVCSQIQVSPPSGLDGFPYKDFPAIKIARLAVDSSFRDNDLGTKLIAWAVAISTTRVMPHVGCRFLAVDSKQQSIKFYEKCGFRLLDTEQNKQRNHPLMFMDIGKLGETS